MKRKKLAYTFLDPDGFGFKSYIVPKNKRHKGQDGIEFCWRFRDDPKKWHLMTIKDWEALVIIQGLSRTLLKKKGAIR